MPTCASLRRTRSVASREAEGAIEAGPDSMLGLSPVMACASRGGAKMSFASISAPSMERGTRHGPSSNTLRTLIAKATSRENDTYPNCFGIRLAFRWH